MLLSGNDNLKIKTDEEEFTIWISRSLSAAWATPLANAGVVLEEDFNQFTDGTTSKPGNVDIAASGKLGDVLLGWTGDAIYEAGGSLFVGTTDVLDFDPHSISTPDLDLDAKMVISASHCV